MADYKEIQRARHLIRREIKSGRLQPASTQACSVCGRNRENTPGIRIIWHHPDYSKPLEVVAVCASHHKEMHPDGSAAKNASLVQVVISKKDRDLLRRMAKKSELPMTVVLKSAIYKLAREWKVSENEPDEERSVLNA